MVQTGMETSQSVDPRMPSAECSAPPFVDPACDLVTVPTRQGLEAVDILRRGACDGVGPVLHDDGDDTLGFLVPPGTAAAWDLPGSTCTETNGRGLRLAPDPEPPVEGSDWLLPPGDADLATDPEVLRAALGEAARLIEAADGCR
ncbi:hypothetical protein [Streptomyces prunicolor]|uniref:Uncharacterized protein n=1 Tax=Streptomyces prunicolor TaxID=67348 RepID=A0ABU4FNC6_9ACTN|nr:hypothetical protein [Streptomyces prunicolor]MCX5234484.1 hypothetical protein [Streptomyces prunicolor]MDV7222085.1 hypothetical protein [Streptomyces prunicolor]